MIIITSVGRSGTSFLTKFLSECGLSVGSDRWYEPIQAGMENKETIAINQNLIRHFVKGEKINLWRVYADIEDLNYDVVKDPSFLTDVRLIESWWKVRKDLKVIFLYRDPQDVVDSIKKVPEWGGPVYRCFPEMIERKNNQFLDTCAQLKIPIKKFKYPQFLDNETEVIGSLSDWIEFDDDDDLIWRKLKK